MFEKVQAAPPDAIFGLTEQFNRDPNPEKINLCAGVYRDSEGKTPIFHSVKRAERRVLQEETSKEYVGINGSPDYAATVKALLFGTDHEVVTGKRAVTVQTPGGTGALRAAAEFIRKMFPKARVHLSDPTWSNHANIFAAAGVEMQTYPYFDSATNGLAFERMLEALKEIPEADVVLLHGCCHNPTGADPSPEQWAQIADVIEQRKLLPLVDLAYQGLGSGVREDTVGLLGLCRSGMEVFVASSSSKNFGLYCERVGALTVVASSQKAGGAVLSQLMKIARASYSNPPAHGASIVTTVLNDPQLRSEWEGEVKEMRDRIHRMRVLFPETLKSKGVERDFSFVIDQRGLFSLTGLTREQVTTLREKYSIYMVNSGRINVAGMTESNMDRLCEAIGEVL